MNSEISHVGVITEQGAFQGNQWVIPEWSALCLWAALGLIVSAVVFGLVYGGDVVQASEIIGP